MSEIADRYMRGNPVAQSTIDALMYSLRSGCGVLSRRDVQQGLTAVDEKLLHDICKQLQNRNPNVAKSWTVEQVEQLVTARAACHDG
jgi:hypothetical protein